MKVTLLGTGASDSWPDPFCHCESCDEERRAGRFRANTCALVDDTIMCDWGPHATAQGARFNVDFAAVRAALITHGHPDHFAPQFLMWRSWLPGLTPLHVYGPSQVIADAQHWVGPADQLHVVQAFDQWVIPAANGAGPWTVSAIPANHSTGNGDVYADECLLYDICDSQGHRLLYATDTASLATEVLDRIDHEPWDMVLLEETFGRHTDHGTGHHDLVSFAATVQELRTRALITEDSRVVAIHLGHHNPALPALREHLAALGAEVHDDGTVLHTRSSNRGVHLIIGGTRSGKSTYAEERMEQYPQVTYVATGYPTGDASWQERVAKHRARRPAHWQTVETIDLVSAVRNAKAPLLIDCLNLWLSRILDDTWSDAAYAREHAARETHALIEALDCATVPIVIVTNDVSMSLVPTNEVGRLFQELLGELNTRIAAHCQDVTMVVAGQPLRIT